MTKSLTRSQIVQRTKKSLNLFDSSYTPPFKTSKYGGVEDKQGKYVVHCERNLALALVSILNKRYDK